MTAMQAAPDTNSVKAHAREQMDIVVIGHVDHGKSTLVGRLLADTGSLPEGKLDQVKDTCRRNAKPFEYAFLLENPREPGERLRGATPQDPCGSPSEMANRKKPQNRPESARSPLMRKGLKQAATPPAALPGPKKGIAAGGASL